MLPLISLLTISFMLYSGCSESDSAEHSSLDPAAVGTESGPTPPEAERPVADDSPRPGEGEAEVGTKPGPDPVVADDPAKPSEGEAEVGTKPGPDPVVTDDPAKLGEGQSAEADPEKTPDTTAIALPVPEIRPAEGDEIKLDQTLLALVRARREGGGDAVKAMVAEGRIELEAEDRVRVEVTVTTAAAVAELKQQIAAVGGEVSTEFQNRIYALVPTASVETLAAEESVWNMAVPQVVASPFGAPR